MIRNKSELRKKIKEVNALKKDIHSVPFGISKYQMQKIEKLYSKFTNSVEPQLDKQHSEPNLSVQPKQRD